MLAQFAFICVLSGCVSTGYRDLPFESLSATKATTGPNNGFVEDAMPIKGFHLFPASVSSKIETESKAGSVANQRNIQALICDGKKPRYEPRLKAEVVSTKPAHGVALDVSARGKTQFHALAREYLKNHYLDDSSERFISGNQIQTENDELREYRRCMVAPDQDRRCGLFTLLVPTVGSAEKAKITEQYQKTVYTPTFAEMRWGKDAMRFRTQFLGFVFPDRQSVVMTPKVLNVEQVDFHPNGEITTADFQATVEGIDASSDLYGVKTRVNFVPSPNGYKSQDGKVLYTLNHAVLTDLAILKENFAFVLPNDVIESLVDRDIYGRVPTYQAHYFGISPETKTFSAKYALEHRDYVWRQYLKHQTSLAEAAQDDGTIRYELSLDLTLFCTYGTPIADLASP